MSFRTTICVVIISLLCVGSARASILPWENTPGAGDNIKIKMSDYENLVDFRLGAGDILVTGDAAAGEFQYGVGLVTEILNTTAINTAWDRSSPDDGELTFTITDFELESVVVSGSNADLYFTGGILKIYYDATKDAGVSPANTVVAKGTNAAPDVSGDYSDGMLNLTLIGATGLFSNEAGTVFDESLATLRATVDTSTATFEASGDGLFDVTGGLLASVFDNNAFTAGSDIDFSTTLRASGAGSGKYEVLSEDPLLTQYVPEPMSIILWAGLAGLAGLATVRKQFKNK